VQGYSRHVARHPFDEYLKAQPRPQRDTLRAIAATLADLLPGADPCISYGMPAFKADGVAVAGFAGFAHHCSYFPHSGSVIPALGARLAAFDCDRGTLRFAIDRPLPRSVLAALVRERIHQVNDAQPSNGKVRSLFDNGVVRHRGSMRNGERHGEWSWYRKDGSLLRTARFRNGEQVRQ
jgi:uncharacterized protein YdhG (YjbR/CyaY superfamily)